MRLRNFLSSLLFLQCYLTIAFHVGAISGSVNVASAVEVGEECDANDGSCAAPVNSDDIGDEDDQARPCADAEPRCESWAGMGECENNPNYMLSE